MACYIYTVNYKLVEYVNKVAHVRSRGSQALKATEDFQMQSTQVYELHIPNLISQGLKCVRDFVHSYVREERTGG